MQMRRCVSYQESSSFNISYLHCLYRMWMISSQWIMAVMPAVSVCVCLLVCVCVYGDSSVFPVVRSWQALQEAKVQRSAMIHAANSGSPPHLFTTWTRSSCSVLNITWQKGMPATVCVCVHVCVWGGGCVFPTVLAAVRLTFWIIIPLWNVTFQTQWPQADHRRGAAVNMCMCVSACAFVRPGEREWEGERPILV